MPQRRSRRSTPRFHQQLVRSLARSRRVGGLANSARTRPRRGIISATSGPLPGYEVPATRPLPRAARTALPLPRVTADNGPTAPAHPLGVVRCPSQTGRGSQHRNRPRVGRRVLVPGRPRLTQVIPPSLPSLIVSRRLSVSTSFVLAALTLRCGRCMLTPPTRREQVARTGARGNNDARLRWRGWLVLIGRSRVARGRCRHHLRSSGDQRWPARSISRQRNRSKAEQTVLR
jgi:hypothetical protein